MTFLLVLLLCVACAGVAALIAQGKGRSVGGFAMAGLLLGVIGVIWAACAEPGADIANRKRLQSTRGPSARNLRDMRPMSWRD